MSRVIARHGDTVVIGEEIAPLHEPAGYSMLVIGEPYLRLYGDWNIEHLAEHDDVAHRLAEAAVREILATHTGNVWDHELALEVMDAVLELTRPPEILKLTRLDHLKEIFHARAH